MLRHRAICDGVASPSAVRTLAQASSETVRYEGSTYSKMWLGDGSVRIVVLLIGLIALGQGCSEPEPETFIRPVRSIVVGDVDSAARSSVPALDYTGAYAFANVILTIAGTLIVRL
jgi:hypothetical protein